MRAQVASQSAPDRSLDQWRGLALVFVLISHGFHYPKDYVPGIGRVGVNLFFFISGILVFRSLERGPRGFKDGAAYFLSRRIRRLIPAKYFYLSFVVLAIFLAGPVWVSREFREAEVLCLPSCLLYFRNYYNPPFNGISPFSGMTDNLTGHLWSLACEMQFYVLAPFIYFLGGKPLIRRSLIWGVILLLLLWEGVSVVGRGGLKGEVYTFQTSVWPMMAGFFMEFIFSTFRSFCNRSTFVLIGLGIFGLAVLPLAMFQMKKQLVVAAGAPLLAGCLGCYWKGWAPRNWIGNSFHYLGNRTYSIYLWQQPLTIGGFVPAGWHALGSLLAIPVGALSFRWLEMPFMSKFKRGAAKKTVIGG